MGASGDLAQRCLLVADYMLAHRATVRQAAGAFGMSKSSVHKDMHERLPLIDRSTAEKVETALQHGKSFSSKSSPDACVGRLLLNRRKMVYNK